MSVLATIQNQVGGCREWLPETTNCCWAPAEYVLWGKLIPAEGLGPRCYDHAAKYLGHHALARGANYALVNLAELAEALEAVPDA